MWLNKYKPAKKSDLVGNGEACRKFAGWLADHKTHAFGASLVIGERGVGKNCMVECCLREAGYTPMYCSSSDFKAASFGDKLMRALGTCAVQNMMEHKARRAVIIDDADSISLLSEKDNMLALIRALQGSRVFPLVFISGASHSKFVLSLKKACLEVRCYAPRPYELRSLLRRIAASERMKIAGEAVEDTIISASQSDIRRLVLTMHDVHITFPGQVIDRKAMDLYGVLSQQKTMQLSIFDSAKQLLDAYPSMPECLSVYETEKVLLPLTLYENYFRVCHDLTSDNINTFADLVDSVSIGDLIETNIYSDQNWYFQMMHGFHTCVMTSYLLDGFKSPKLSQYKLQFSCDLNKTSLKNINRKNIANFINAFPDKTFADVQFMNKLLSHMSKDMKPSQVTKLKQEYSIPTKMWDVVMKVDKTKSIDTVAE